MSTAIAQALEALATARPQGDAWRTIVANARAEHLALRTALARLAGACRSGHVFVSNANALSDCMAALTAADDALRQKDPP